MKIEAFYFILLKKTAFLRNTFILNGSFAYCTHNFNPNFTKCTENDIKNVVNKLIIW